MIDPIDDLRRQIEDAEAARADALHPAFGHKPRLTEVAHYDELLERLHAEHDEIEEAG